jgi:carbamoyltransferase
LINNSLSPGIIFAKTGINGITLLNKKPSYSLGAVYSAYIKYLGFKANSDEYRVMGLAAFGRPVHKDRIISFKDKIAKLGVKKRLAAGELTQEHKDLAASVQSAIEEETLKLSAELHNLTGSKNLCLSGDMALNCLVNSRILKQGLFKKIWIQPAASWAGTSLGAGLMLWHSVLGQKRQISEGMDLMQSCFLGPGFDDAYIEKLLVKYNVVFQKLEPAIIAVTGADLISQGKVLGWFQGRMEFGPRALGARSILGDSRNPGIHDRLNLRIKFRENFRPFAPTVLDEKAGEYFDLDRESPYMLFTASVKENKRKEIAAVTHADNSSRVQTLKREDNPLYYNLVNEFFKKTSCPVIINTSFNTKNEPIVRTPEEALRCFSATDMDYLLIGRFLIDKRSLK